MDPATYEHLRNKTLLFFIEKLLDPTHGNNNNAPDAILYTNKRTLHDLSCQFGSKGFTKEMRQIAGGSQSGLKKFLLTYPSIFRIDGDMVSYNVNSTTLLGGKQQQSDAAEISGDDQPSSISSTTATTTTTSIDNEAVEYFRERLMQYGIGIWVPIKSLLGHRSQAPPHIRHVSGQHIREFTQFLGRYPDTFILNAQDEVLLKEFENYYEKDGAAVAPPNSRIDRKKIVELIEFYGGCLSERGPMLVEQLFCAGNLKFDDEDSSSGVEHFKTPNDLATFFKMYPQCFLVHSNLVTFSDSYKVGLEYLKRQSGVVSSLSSSSTPTTILPVKPSPVPQPPRPKPEQPKQIPSPAKELPKALPPQQPAVQKNLLKHRVSKILLQAINQNTEHDYKHDSTPLVLSPTTTTTGASKESNNNPIVTVHSNQFQSLCESGDTDELRNYILGRTTIVSNQRKATQIIDEIIKASEPVAVDFEGINLGNDGQVTLVQVGTSRGSVFIFDVLTQVGLIEQGERSLLGRLLTGPVTKVMHDCRNDSVNLYRQFGIRLKNVFDTQVAHIVVQMTGSVNNNNEESEEGSKGAGNSNSLKNISLNNLCSVYGTVCNPFKDKVKSVYRHDQKYWSRRPLTKQMIAYASCDVMCLVPSIYQNLHARVTSDPDKLKLFNELCEEQILTHIEPDEIRSRRRLRKNEADLRALREKLDKAFSDEKGTSNSSLVLSNREMRLLKHLNLTEEEKEKLKLSLKVAKKLEKMSSSTARASSADDSQVHGQQHQSSDSASNSELTSLEYSEVQQQQGPSSLDPRIAQIDSLEAIINRLINDNNNENNNRAAANNQDFVCGDLRGGGIISSTSCCSSSRGDDDDDDEEEHHARLSRVVVDSATQTISTGDIVITKVFDD